MRFASIIPLFALLVSVSAGIKDLPGCTTNCTSPAATDVGCTLDDETCLCSHSDFSSNIIHCAQGVCGVHDVNDASNILYQMCKTSASSASLPSSSTSSTSISSSVYSSMSTSTTSNPTATPADLGTTGPINPTMTSKSSSMSSSTLKVIETVVVSQTPNISTSGAMRRVFSATLPLTVFLSTIIAFLRL